MTRRAQLAALGLALAVGLVAWPAAAQWVSQYLGRTFTSTAPANVNGFACRAAGCRFDVGPGASDYIWSSGTELYTPVRFNAQGGLAVLNADVTGQGAFRWAAGTALPTCGSTYEGEVRRLSGTGGTGTGAQTRFCACVSDGAGTPAYSWRNVISGTAGTASTCNP